MHRSGSLFDIPVILIAVFTVSIAFLIGHLILTEVKANTTDDQIDQDTLDKGLTALEVGDAGIIFINGMMWLAAFIFAVRIPSRPEFFFLAIPFIVISAWLSAELGNIYNIITTVDKITPSANAFPTVLTLFENFPLVTGFLGVALVVGIYAKMRGRARGGV